MSAVAEPLSAPWYVEAVRTNGTRFAEAVRIGPLDADVASCPGWALRDLAHHLGYIHRWARLAAATGARPDESLIDAPPAGGSDELADWMLVGVDALTATLAAVDGAGPTWHPDPVERVGAVWPRRQAQETSVHRWDAEQAIGVTATLDPVLAADGIAEYFELIVPRLISRDLLTVPIGSLRISCEDAGRHLTITSLDGASVSSTRQFGAAPDDPDDGEPDAVLAADAESILLALWGRRPFAAEPEHPAVRAWFGIGGN